jgi:hypothetical protein
VLGVASVDDLMGKFDEDGSGQLDEDELKQLRAYINQKRKENQERIRKLQESVGQGGQGALRPDSALPRVGARCLDHCVPMILRRHSEQRCRYKRAPVLLQNIRYCTLKM